MTILTYLQELEDAIELRNTYKQATNSPDVEESDFTETIKYALRAKENPFVSKLAFAISNEIAAQMQGPEGLWAKLGKTLDKNVREAIVDAERVMFELKNQIDEEN